VKTIEECLDKDMVTEVFVKTQEKQQHRNILIEDVC